MKKFIKNTIDTSVGASILPVGMGAIRGEGSMGSAASTVMVTGLVKKTGKKFGVF